MEKVYFLIFLCTLMLAILSRKHFSKYKGGGLIKVLFFSMGETLYCLFKKFFSEEKVRERIKNNRVITGKRLNMVVKEYYVKMFSLCLGVFITFTSFSAVLFFVIGDGEKTDNIAVREGYGGEDTNKCLILSNGSKEQVCEISISPQILTRDEFYERTDEIFNCLYSDILGDNQDLSHVVNDLNLSEHDKDRLFEINWRSDNPEYISSSGAVKQGETEVIVCLTASIEYMEYSAEHVYELVVCAANTYDRDFDEAIAVLEGIEAESRASETVLFPNTIGDIKVTAQKEKNKAYLVILALGLLTPILLIIKKFDELKKENKMRDAMLVNNYSDLVNHIWLFLGTGMTIKNALTLFARNKDENMILVKEISLCLNLIDAGENEAQAYEDLGRRLGVSEYNRLFSHISQNLRMGTKDIRNIMEDELLLAETTRRELIKRKGEEASTKLIFPMVIMLAVVMVIVMVPALAGFV